MGDQKTKDWWDKADILAKFTSSIVLATIGLLITYTIQKNQIEVAKINSETEKKIKQGSLTSQLIQYLSSNNSTQREIAIVALKDNIDSISYQKILSISATNDVDKKVRISAINELGNYKKSVPVLSKIARNPKVSKDERKKAYIASINASLTESGLALLNEGNYYFLGAGELAGENYNGGYFTTALIETLKSNPFISLKALMENISKVISITNQAPFISTNSTQDLIVDKNFINRSKVISIGSNNYEASNFRPLSSAESDAKKFNKFMENLSIENFLLMSPSSKKIKEAFKKIADNISPTENVIFYYSGHSYIDDKLGLVLITVEGNKISIDELKLYLKNAKNTLIFWDACSVKYRDIVDAR